MQSIPSYFLYITPFASLKGLIFRLERDEALLAALWIILPIFLIYGCAGAMHKVASVLCTLWEQPKIALQLDWLTIILDSIKLKHIAHILHNKPQLFHGSN